MTYGEVKENVLKKIEEYEGSVMPSDTDIANKLPILINEGINNILQVKQLKRGVFLEPMEQINGRTYYKLPDDVYLVTRIGIDNALWHITPDGLLEISKDTDAPIHVEYAAYHPAIEYTTKDDTEILLDPECLPVLMNFAASGLVTDDGSIFSYFTQEYRTGLQNLINGKEDLIIKFIDNTQR